MFELGVLDFSYKIKDTIGSGERAWNIEVTARQLSEQGSDLYTLGVGWRSI